MNLRDLQSLQKKSVKFQVQEILPRVIHLNFARQTDLTSTLLRFQEFYESPKFRNQLFTMPEFVRWYKTTRNGKFSYLTDWSGFNFPSSVVKTFRKKLKTTQMTPREQQVLLNCPDRGRFYIIGTYGKTNNKNYKLILKHELAHALYFLDPEYKKAVHKVLAQVEVKPIHQYLKKLGYDKSVWMDETNAYILTDQDALLESQISISKNVSHRLDTLFNRYYQKYSKLIK
jgi:hypothetical protein